MMKVSVKLEIKFLCSIKYVNLVELLKKYPIYFEERFKGADYEDISGLLIKLNKDRINELHV